MSLWDYIRDLANINKAVGDAIGVAWARYLVMAVISMAVIVLFLVVSQLLLVWMERKVIGRIQVRYGPNRAGPIGILQTVADAIKLFVKEDFTPRMADRWVFRLAPVVAVAPAIMVFAVFPFTANMVFANLNIGILYIIALSSLGTIAVFMAGWSSYNKYSLLGAMRAIAQTVSYELPLAFSIVGVLLAVGSLNMVDIVKAQTIPYLLVQPLGFLIFMIAALAELNRTPFDIMEAEQEIVAGYHTEYSGLSFSLFYMAEYFHALAASAIVTTLFLGGWKPDIGPAWLWFIVKMYLVFFVLMWIRGTLPRLRVDQLMSFAWKFLLPLALINIFVIGLEVYLWPDFPEWLALVNIPLAVVLVVGWSQVFRLGTGRVEVAR